MNLSQLITRIKISCGIYSIALPFENPDEVIKDVIENIKDKYDLIIVDPLNADNNVGKNTRQFNNIKLAFMIGFIASKEECECGCHYQFHNSVQCGDIEHCILKRIFNAVKRFTPDSVA